MGTPNYFRSETLSEELDNENSIIIRIFYSQDTSKIVSFAVIQCWKKDGAIREIVRFDASPKESVNVHRFYSKSHRKKILGNPINWDTVLELKEEIMANWQRNLLLYRQKKGL